MARYRSIKDTIEYCRENDPDTALTEWALRNMVNTGKISCLMVGNKHLIDIDTLDEQLAALRELQQETAGRKRRVWKIS